MLSKINHAVHLILKEKGLQFLKYRFAFTYFYIFSTFMECTSINTFNCNPIFDVFFFFALKFLMALIYNDTNFLISK